MSRTWIGHYASDCPNKKLMILRDDGEVELANDECESMSALEDVSDVKDVNGESLVIRRSLNVQVSKVNVKQQKENIFHTTCHIKNKVYSMIIDNILISFLVWRYKDRVLCDVVPMHVAH